MTEATLVRQIIESLKKSFPRAVIFKIQDIYTAGIPDISVDWNDSHIWIEVKLFKFHETASTVSKHFDRLQLATMRLLERQTMAFYLIGLQRRAVGTALGLWSPDSIVRALDLPHPEETMQPCSKFAATMEYVAQKIDPNGIRNT